MEDLFVDVSGADLIQAAADALVGDDPPVRGRCAGVPQLFPRGPGLRLESHLQGRATSAHGTEA